MRAAAGNANDPSNRYGTARGGEAAIGRIDVRIFPRNKMSGRANRAIKEKIAMSGFLASAASTTLSFFWSREMRVEAGELMARPASYPWESEGIFKSLDHAAIRRGWQVYKTVCQTCHGIQFVRFDDMVNVSHTEREVKAIAGEYEVEDGPDEEGKFYMRPGKLHDRVPSPFANEEAARAANFGANPPDLSYIVLARKNGRNYLYSLLTGYTEEVPAGVSLRDGQYFNPYFSGGCIAMGQMLQENVVAYEDGTAATVSQMAKDVVEFLSWTSGHEHDTRKITMMRGIGVLTILLFVASHLQRHSWSYLRSRRLDFVSKRKC